jgi:thiol-disulfide isomerase/thioredoxin
MTDTQEFRYRVVLFRQPGCPACEAMTPIFAQVAGEVEEEYPELRVGWGEFDVLEDNWEFLESLVPGESGNGTPEFAVFDEECDLIAFNGDGIMPASQLKDFVISSIRK